MLGSNLDSPLDIRKCNIDKKERNAKKQNKTKHNKNALNIVRHSFGTKSIISTREALVIYYNYLLRDKAHSSLTHQWNAGYFLPKLANILLRIMNFNGITNAAG